jgi:hypothetical protein
MLLLFQVGFLIVSAGAIVRVWQRKNQGLLSTNAAVRWALFWLLAIVVVMWPGSASTIAHAFGIGRGADFIIYVAIAVLFLTLFRLHISLAQLQQDVTKIVRHTAFCEKKAHKETHKDGPV